MPQSWRQPAFSGRRSSPSDYDQTTNRYELTKKVHGWQPIAICKIDQCLSLNGD